MVSKRNAEIASDTVTPSEVPELRRATLLLLRRYNAAPDEEATALFRSIAECLVEVRGKFSRPDGSPDWKGHTWAYRSFVRDLYDDAGIQRAEQPRIQAAVRYHIGSVLRERLDDATLAEYELIPKSPRERSQDRRGNRTALLNALTAREVSGGSLLALSAAYTLLSKLSLDDLETLDGREREVAAATLADLERRVRQLRKRIAALAPE